MPNNQYASTRKGNKIYLHILNTDTASIAVKKIPGIKILNVQTMGGEKISLTGNTDLLNIPVPLSFKEKTVGVIVLETDTQTSALPVVQ